MASRSRSHFSDKAMKNAVELTLLLLLLYLSRKKWSCVCVVEEARTPHLRRKKDPSQLLL